MLLSDMPDTQIVLSQKDASAYEGTREDESTCPQCGEELNGSKCRLVQDACGHRKCRMCLLREENGCETCKSLNAADHKVVKKEIIVPSVIAACENGTKSTEQPLEATAADFKEENTDRGSIITVQSNQSTQVDIPPSANKNTVKKRKPLIIYSHINVTPGNPPLFQCNICRKVFKTRGHIRYHESCPTGEKPLQCEICGQGFVSKSHYEYHKRNHTGDRPHVCGLCGKGFSQKGKLTRHSRCHTGERPFVCDLCGKGFSNSHALRSHRLIHTGEKPHSCHHCGKRFTEQTNLKKHLIVHTGEKKYMCEDCGKSFGLKWTLDLHRRIHTGDRPHSCSLCGRSFGNVKDLRRHSLIHSGERPFSCSVCGTTFRRKDNLERHMKNTHPELRESYAMPTSATPVQPTNYQPVSVINNTCNVNNTYMVPPTSQPSRTEDNIISNCVSTITKAAPSLLSNNDALLGNSVQDLLQLENLQPSPPSMQHDQDNMSITQVDQLNSVSVVTATSGLCDDMIEMPNSVKLQCLKTVDITSVNVIQEADSALKTLADAARTKDELMSLPPESVIFETGKQNCSIRYNILYPPNNNNYY